MVRRSGYPAARRGEVKIARKRPIGVSRPRGGSVKIRRTVGVGFVVAALLVPLVPSGVAAAVPTVACGSIADVSAADPDCGAIQWLADADNAVGSSWYPKDVLTRGAAVRYIYAALHPGSTPGPCRTAPFRDVPATSAWCGYATWAKEAKVLRADTNGTVRLRAAVKRGQFADMMYRAAHSGKAAEKCRIRPVFDVKVKRADCGAIAWLFESAIDMPRLGGLYQPGRPALRGEAAGLVHRAYALKSAAAMVTDDKATWGLASLGEIVQTGVTLSSFALGADGAVWQWGHTAAFVDPREKGEPISATMLAVGSTPGRVTGLPAIDKVYPGFANSLGVARDGTAWIWGHAVRRGSVVQIAPRKMPGIKNVVDAADGGVVTVALLADGTVWAWGRGYNGQLGLGHKENAKRPTRIPGLHNIVALSSDGSEIYALQSNGTVWGWGSDYMTYAHGRFASRPVQIKGLKNIVKIVPTSLNTFALRADGTVWAWGLNFAGELGDGTKTRRVWPVRVAGLTGVTDIARGEEHGGEPYALRSDGTVWTWGNRRLNEDKRLRPPPLQRVLTDVAALAPDRATRTDRTVWAISNRAGKYHLGRFTPSRVRGIAGPVWFSGSRAYALVRR